MASLAARLAYWERRGRPRATGSAGAAPTVTFPTTPLVIRARIALGADLTASPATWAWRDISDRIRWAQAIRVTTGRPGRSDPGVLVQPGDASMTLGNPDGLFSRLNPNSEFFGLLSRNTPIWITIDAGTGEYDLLKQFVVKWPKRGIGEGKDSIVSITCAGVLDRLIQGARAKSAIARTVMSAALVIPVAYWPMQDGADATVAGSAIADVPPLTGVLPTFAEVDDLPGSDPLPDFLTGSLSATFTPSTRDTGEWQVEFWARITTPTTPTLTDAVNLISFTTTNPAARVWTLQAQYTAQILTLFEESGAMDVPETYDAYDNEWHHYQLTGAEDGAGNLTVALIVDGVELGSSTDVFDAGAISGVRVAPGGATQDGLVSIGHVAVWDTITSPTDRIAAGTAHVGEQAHLRIARLCAEEGIEYTTLAASSTTCGPQATGSIIEVIRDAEKADQGVLYESGWGLGYQALSERLNATPWLELDFANSEVKGDPTIDDDDTHLRNLWQITRRDGAVRVAYDEDSIAKDGLHDDQDIVNTETDDQALGVAGWRVREGILDEDRWPGLLLQLNATPHLIPTYLSMPFGARVTAANPPAELPPDLVDQIVEGKTVTVTSLTWDVELATGPASVYRVGRLVETAGVSAATVGKYGATSCALDTAVDDTATSWLVNSTPVWTVRPQDFPTDVKIAGEVVTVNSVTGGSNPQTWDVVRSVNGVVKDQAAGERIRLVNPIVYVP